MEHVPSVNTVFVKRTRRGQIKTHVRQHYLRDDLPTGSPRLDDAALEPRLSPSARQYLVLDTNVVLHQIDLLERSDMRDVIVLQTVLKMSTPTVPTEPRGWGVGCQCQGCNSMTRCDTL